jgi:hypothetical protein
MLPTQSAFTLLVPTAMRGRVFGLAGALSVGVTGLCFLLAGWISGGTGPAASVGICAVLTLGVLILLAARWPHREITASVEKAFSGMGDDAAGVEGAAEPPNTPSDPPPHGREQLRREPIRDPSPPDRHAQELPEPSSRPASGG